MNNFVERIKKLMDEKNILQKDLVGKIGCSKGYVSGVCNGSKPPSENFIMALSELTNKSVHWLIHGKEEDDNFDILNAIINAYIETGFITSVESITDSTRKALNEMMDKEIDNKLKKRYRD